MCTNHVDQIIIFFVVLGCIGAGDTVRITALRVPAVARHGGGSVVLDCDYALDGPADGEGLVVKWYLNDQSRPVYQWIPGSAGGPRGLGALRGRLNLGYRASEDARTEHRALHIPQPAHDMSGEYTCVVSTFHGEDRQTKTMLVFVPEKNLRLRQGRTSDGIPNVICSADGVFPEPEMAIRMTHENVSRDVEGTPVLRREGDGGLYDITMMATLTEDFLDTPTPTSAVFTCELRLPKANYTVRKEFVYYAGNSGPRTVSATGFLIVLSAVIKFLC